MPISTPYVLPYSHSQRAFCLLTSLCSFVSTPHNGGITPRAAPSLVAICPLATLPLPLSSLRSLGKQWPNKPPKCSINALRQDTPPSSLSSVLARGPWPPRSFIRCRRTIPNCSTGFSSSRQRSEERRVGKECRAR